MSSWKGGLCGRQVELLTAEGDINGGFYRHVQGQSDQRTKPPAYRVATADSSTGQAVGMRGSRNAAPHRKGAG